MYSLQKVWKYLFKCFLQIFKVWWVHKYQGVTFLVVPAKNRLAFCDVGCFGWCRAWSKIQNGKFVVVCVNGQYIKCWYLSSIEIISLKSSLELLSQYLRWMQNVKEYIQSYKLGCTMLWFKHKFLSLCT
jgi:hypothetical protein